MKVSTAQSGVIGLPMQFDVALVGEIKRGSPSASIPPANVAEDMESDKTASDVNKALRKSLFSVPTFRRLRVGEKD